MFDQIFERSDALRRQLGGPLREERLAYLHHRAEQGAPRSTLRKLAQYLLVITERLNLRHHGTVTIAQIERAADQWARRHAGVRIDFSRPGKPTDNAYVESFNGTLRTECLDAHWFGSLTEAKEIIEAWRREYNESRPHRAHGERTPHEIACEFAASREFTSTKTAGDSLSG